jgi:Peptidase family M23
MGARTGRAASVRWGRALALACLLLGVSWVAGAASAHSRLPGTLRSVTPRGGDRSASAELPPRTAFSVFAASVLTRPAPVAATDGKVHIVYELVLTNMTPAKLRIDAVQVRNAGTQRVLLSLRNQALAADVRPVGGAEASGSGDSEDLAGLHDSAVATSTSPTGGVTVAGSQSVIVWLDVRVRDYAAVPKVLAHQVIASFVSPPPGAPSSLPQSLIQVPTVRHRPIVLGPPVGAGDWYASEGCCDPATHHRGGLISINGRMLVPQRFAIDWFRLDSRHRAWVGSPSRLSSYLAYRQPAIAAAAGTVVRTQDGLPNNPDIPQPPTIPPIQNTVGNHVVLRVAPGVYLLYAHFDPGSLRVHVGERVRRGQVLGLIGTSGNSTTPHLHFQVMTTPTFFPTDSPPFVFGRFTVRGRVTKRIWDDNLGLQPTGRLPFVAARDRTIRRREMPLDRQVISFKATSAASIRDQVLR